VASADFAHVADKGQPIWGCSAVIAAPIADFQHSGYSFSQEKRLRGDLRRFIAHRGAIVHPLRGGRGLWVWIFGPYGRVEDGISFAPSAFFPHLVRVGVYAVRRQWVRGLHAWDWAKFIAVDGAAAWDPIAERGEIVGVVVGAFYADTAHGCKAYNCVFERLSGDSLVEIMVGEVFPHYGVFVRGRGVSEQ